MKKYVILAATGQIGQLTTKYLLNNNDANLVLFGHNASQRLQQYQDDRIDFVDGDLKDTSALKQAFRGADAVFLAYVATPDIMKPLVKTLDESGVKRFIAMSVPDIY